MGQRIRGRRQTTSYNKRAKTPLYQQKFALGRTVGSRGPAGFYSKAYPRCLNEPSQTNISNFVTSTQYLPKDEEDEKNISQVFEDIRFLEKHASYEVLEERFIVSDPMSDSEHLKGLPKGFKHQETVELATAESQYRETRKSKRSPIMSVVPTIDGPSITDVGQGVVENKGVNENKQSDNRRNQLSYIIESGAGSAYASSAYHSKATILGVHSIAPK